MNSNKGVTLTSVIIYIIGMSIVVGVISTLTSYFYKNIDIEDINAATGQYTKFTQSFAEETNKENNSVIDCKTNYIVFSSGNQYTYMTENKSIYKNNIKICENVDICSFSYSIINGKYSVTVEFKAGNIDFTGNDAIKYIIGK